MKLIIIILLIILLVVVLITLSIKVYQYFYTWISRDGTVKSINNDRVTLTIERGLGESFSGYRIGSYLECIMDDSPEKGQQHTYKISKEKLKNLVAGDYINIRIRGKESFPYKTSVKKVAELEN